MRALPEHPLERLGRIAFHARRAVPLGLVLGLLPLAQAQVIHRIVGPDGRVTFTDMPPAAVPAPATSAASSSASATGARSPTPATVAAAAAPSASPSIATSSASASARFDLPYALRAVAARFPVTLLTGSACAPCDQARQWLVARGVPFEERTVNTAADNAALQRLTGGNSLPYLTIGQQGLRGFTESQWDSYLDAAGYTKPSPLPRSYRQAPPQALAGGVSGGGTMSNAAGAAVTAAGGDGASPDLVALPEGNDAAPMAPAAPVMPPSAPVLPPPDPANPLGIRF